MEQYFKIRVLKTSNIFELKHQTFSNSTTRVMLGGLLSSISALVLTHRVATRHLIPSTKQGLYHPAEDAIFSALSKDSNDISVYWGVYESGKTTAVRNAGLKLQQMDRMCVVLEGYDLTFPKDFARTLRMRIGVPNDRTGRRKSVDAHQPSCFGRRRPLRFFGKGGGRATQSPSRTEHQHFACGRIVGTGVGVARQSWMQAN